MKRGLRAGLPQYTYKQKNTAEKTLYRRLLFFGGLTLVLIAAIWFWGVTFVSVLGFLGTDSPDESDGIAFELPLRKPTLEDLPEFTNKEAITVAGSINPEVNLVLYVNGIESGETTADAGGNFSFANISLKEGLNLIKIVAKNTSGETQEITALATLDNKKPKLKITSPKNGQTFPKKTDSITVNGQAEPEAVVFVNLIQAIVDADGNFKYNLTLSPGVNNIEIKAADKAGNEEATKLSVTVEK
jgi:hypothetical protein